MTSRLDNLTLEDLIERSAEASAELELIGEEIKARLLRACPVRPGMVYRFNDKGLPWKTGKRFLVNSLRPERAWSLPREAPSYFLGVHGYNELKRSSAGDGFAIKPAMLRGWDCLDPATGVPGPQSRA